MDNRIKIGVLGGAAAAGIWGIRKWRNDRRHRTVRQRIRQGVAGAMLATAGIATRFKGPRRLSKKIGFGMMGRSLAFWKGH